MNNSKLKQIVEEITMMKIYNEDDISCLFENEQELVISSSDPDNVVKIYCQKENWQINVEVKPDYELDETIIVEAYINL